MVQIHLLIQWCSFNQHHTHPVTYMSVNDPGCQCFAAAMLTKAFPIGWTQGFCFHLQTDMSSGLKHSPLSVFFSHCTRTRTITTAPSTVCCWTGSRGTKPCVWPRPAPLDPSATPSTLCRCAPRCDIRPNVSFQEAVTWIFIFTRLPHKYSELPSWNEYLWIPQSSFWSLGEPGLVSCNRI